MNEEHLKTHYADIGDAVAIIGMAGRFPGARTVDELWNNIKNGVESIRFFSDEELIVAGISQEELNNPRYVKAKGYTEATDLFDAHFFNITPREAEFIDPQQRIFLECAWESLENACCIPDKFDGLIGVYAGVGINFYQLKNLIMNPRECHKITNIQLIIGNDKDYLATRLSYKLNLRGPSIVIQSACSSSLVAIQLACQGLLNYQCDIALSGGSYLTIPQIAGYEYSEAHIVSPDGHCRVFDESASGTVFGDGVGVVTLKRLEDAIEDQDHIYAVIRSIALNNDGSDKVGYTAPSIKGQSDVIKLAHSFAETEPDSIGYIETHGTGTHLGDPIEIAGLKEAFASSRRSGKYCAIGSLKANFGHLDVAAGVAGLIKTALALYYKKIPVSINFTKPNPKLGIEESPFYVNTETKEWTALLDENGKELPRRAGVSSFGVGGTNAHAILEEIQQIASSPSENRSFIFPFSAKLPVSLDAYTEKLADFIEINSTISLADTAFTLQLGRHPFEQRRYIVCHNHKSAVAHLREQPAILTGSGTAPKISQKPVFMFSGQGSQYPGMGKDLYQSNSVFRKYIDTCAEQAKSIISLDIRDIMFGEKNDQVNGVKLAQTALTQPSLFMIEYALAQTWLSIGITPEALIGHSIGEYTAACLSGVMSLEDALFLVCHRGRLMQSVPPGSMLAVRLPEKEVKDRLTGKLTIGVINTDSMCVVSGDKGDIDDFEKTLEKEKIVSRRLHTSHAFHSDMMEPILDEFVRMAEKVTLKAPQIPFISNVSGIWITESDAMSPKYWAQHIRQTVRFAEGITTLLDNDYNVLLEVGPGNTLATIARQQAASRTQIISTIPSQPHPKQDIAGYDFWLSAVGNLWIQNVSIDWNALYGEEHRRRIPLPTYAFDRHRYWIDPDPYYTSFMKTGTVDGVTKIGETDQKKDDKEKENLHTTQTQEDIIQSIWKEMLGVATIEITDNFFDLGGDSIWASQLVNRLNDRFHISLPLNIIFQAPTIRELSDFMETQVVTEDRTFQSSVDAEQIVEKKGQLSLPQQRLWFLSTFAPESPAYNLAVSFELTGDLDVDILKASINDVIDHHEILRTRYVNNDGIPEMVIEPSIHFDFEVRNLEHLDRVDTTEVMVEAIKERNLIPYNLTTSPIHGFLLFKVSDSEHVLVLMVHHISFDGWSLGVFLSELGEFYRARLAGSSPNLTPLAVQYPDFAAWQQRQFLKRDMSVGRDYWKKRLHGAPPILNFPFDKPRPLMPANTGGLVDFTLSPQLTSKLKDICTRERVTMFTLLQSAFKVLIYRYSGQTDILVGSPIANRTRSVDENLIGLFINMIVLWSDMSGNPEFADFLKVEQKNIIEALGHREYPFERILDDLKLKRDISVHPIYQVMFAYQNFDMPTVTAGFLKMRNIVLDRSTSQLDLWLFMYEEGDCLRGAFEYDAELFTISTINRMARHLTMLIESFVSDLTQPIDSIDFMTESEIQQVTFDWNNTDAPYPKDVCIIDLFERQVQLTPDKIAAIFGKESITYSELNKRANCIGNKLQQNNFGTEELIGVCVPRSIDMLVSVLGILKAGCAYLPIDHGFPTNRIKFIFDDAESSLVITVEEYKELFSSIDINSLTIDSDKSIFCDENITTPERKIKPDNRSYVIYTSGSTGTPKGVEIINSSVVNLINSLKKTPGLNSSDKLLAVTSLTFDVSVVDLFLTLSVGATLVIASGDDVSDGAKLLQLIKKHKITAMPATPVTWRIMAESGWQNTPNLKAFCAGEALTEDLAKAIINTGTDLWNIYGPTEATVYASLNKVVKPQESTIIGNPIENVQLYVLDHTNKPVPIGVPGELYIGGEGLARGYLNRPDLTRNAFINVIWGDGNNRQIYKTGDLVKRLQDGRIDFLGRLDNQVKIRGYRIEIGEIEARLEEHPALRNTAVTVHESEHADKRLVAYYESYNDSYLDEKKLKQFLREKLPDYMLPSIFTKVASMPLTVSGKIDRKALQQIEPVYISKSMKAEPPRDGLEKQMTEIWEYVLGVNPVSIHDDFFDIGGDSLVAARLFAVISKRMGITLPLALLFQHPTIADIADSIRTVEYRSKWSSLVPIRVGGDKPGLFLVHGAEGNVILYRDLVKYISDDIPVYGLQSKGLSYSDAYDMSIKDMASRYIREMKTVQPEGPYRLGGYCLGGSIAYEMAQQLEANDDKIELLALIESYNVETIDYPPPWHVKIIENSQNLLFHFLNLTSTQGYNDRLNFLLTKARTERKRISAKFQMLWASLFHKFRENEKLLYPHIEVTNRNHEAQAKYVPVKYNGNVLILKPKNYYYSARDPYYGWGNIVSGDIDVVELNVYPHGSLTEPFVKETGAAIIHYLGDNKNS